MRLRTLAVVPLAVRHRRPAPGTPALTSSALSARYAADAQAIGTAERAAAGDGDSQLAVRWPARAPSTCCSSIRAARAWPRW